MADNEYEIEEIIDHTSLSEVLGMLSSICYGKADHLQTNWQDYAAAKEWQKAARIIDSAQAKLPPYPGIG